MLFKQQSTVVLSLLSLAAAVIGPNDPLAPWEISFVSTFNPSGGPWDSLKSVVNITITDPNTIKAGSSPTGTVVFTPSTTICNVSFVPSALPYNQPFNCSETAFGYWTFEMLEADDMPDPTTNFDVRFTHVDSVWVVASNYTQVYVGTGHFEVGKNMGGLCSASGICAWNLKEESTPYLVNQTRTYCTGACS
jgi:hypothetical protein